MLSMVTNNQYNYVVRDLNPSRRKSRHSPRPVFPKKRPDLVDEEGGGGFWICEAVGARDWRMEYVRCMMDVCGTCGWDVFWYGYVKFTDVFSKWDDNKQFQLESKESEWRRVINSIVKNERWDFQALKESHNDVVE